MKYFDTKKDSLEEAISKAINEKPEQLKEEVIKEAFSKDIQDFISTGGIMSKVIKQARDVTPKELKDKKFLQKILKYWKSTSIDATTTGKKRLQALETGIKQMKEEVIAKDLLEAGGKYLKYSDLLLQKGRLMAKNQSTAMIDKEISKEMKKLNIKEKLDPVGKADGDIDNDGDKDSSDKYLAKRRKAISKAIAKDKKEEDVDLEETDIKMTDQSFDGDKEQKDFLKFMKSKFNLSLKGKIEPGNLGGHTGAGSNFTLSGSDTNIIKYLRYLDDGGTTYLQIYKKKGNVYTAIESVDLESKTTKDVDETLDKIREANVAKGRTMRNILADIWNMGEGKSVFDKEEKVKKEEEDEKGSSKTATGKKATKVEIEPEVK